jgi:hypothetical protein
VRYARGCKPSDLWNPYKTSSDLVAEYVEQYGNPSLMQIRRVFNTIDAARRWETKVLKRMNVTESDTWLNKTDNMSIAPRYGSDNVVHRDGVKLKISESLKRWYQNNPNPRVGYVTPLEVKEKQSKAKLGSLNPFYGKAHTEENKQFFSPKP